MTEELPGYRHAVDVLPDWPILYERDYQNLLRLARAGTLTADDFTRIRGPAIGDADYVMPTSSVGFMRSHHMRDKFIRDFGFGIVTVGYADSLARLLKGLRVLEVCAGNGTLREPMRKRGIDWTSTDIDPWNDSVEELEAMAAVEQYKPDAVYASWVDLGDDLDARLARLLPCVFLAESCTGSQDSEDWWDNDDRGFVELEVPDWFESVPSWSCIRDYTMLTVPESTLSPFHLQAGRVVGVNGGPS